MLDATTKKPRWRGEYDNLDGLAFAMRMPSDKQKSGELQLLAGAALPLCQMFARDESGVRDLNQEEFEAANSLVTPEFTPSPEEWWREFNSQWN